MTVDGHYPSIPGPFFCAIACEKKGTITWAQVISYAGLTYHGPMARRAQHRWCSLREPEGSERADNLPDVAWPAARSAALWAFCRRQNAPEYILVSTWDNGQQRNKLDKGLTSARAKHSLAHASLKNSVLDRPCRNYKIVYVKSQFFFRKCNGLC